MIISERTYTIDEYKTNTGFCVTPCNNFLDNVHLVSSVTSIRNLRICQSVFLLSTCVSTDSYHLNHSPAGVYDGSEHVLSNQNIIFYQ